MDEAELELWGAHWRRTFAAVGGFKEAEEWKPPGNDFTPSPYSVTPTGLLSPNASDHGNDPPRPHEAHPLDRNWTVEGYPSAAELIKRLERVECEQERKQREHQNQTRLSPGTYDKLHDYDVDCTMSDLSSEGSQGSSSSNTSTFPSPPSSELMEDRRSFLESLLNETQSHLVQESSDYPIKEGMGTSKTHLALSSKRREDGSGSTTPAIPGSPVAEPTQAQRAFLEGLLNKPQSNPLPNSPKKPTQETVMTSKRESDSTPSSQPKKRKTCAYKGTESSMAPHGEAPCVLASTNAIQAPASHPIGTLARNAGQEVRRRSKALARNKQKRPVNPGTLRSKISPGDGSLEQMKCEPVIEAMDTFNGECPAPNNSKSLDASPQISEASWPPSKAELLALVEEFNGDPINGDASVDIVDHELKEVQQVVNKELSKQKKESTIGSSSRDPSSRDTVDHRKSPKVARHGREKQKQVVQLVIYQPYARPGCSKASSTAKSHQQKIPQPSNGDIYPTSSTTAQGKGGYALRQPRAPSLSETLPSSSLTQQNSEADKAQKNKVDPQQQNSPARSTRSKTDPNTAFVELNQKGKQSRIENALEAKKAEEEAENQRKTEARDRRWYKKQKQQKKNMQRVWKEWFDEQDDEFECQQAAKGEEVSGHRFYGGYTGSAR